ncbi:MAG TPA: DNA-processing protein DprA [Candidatus Paceibacterota bacterium]|jgi:DNA protecting protein DprA
MNFPIRTIQPGDYPGLLRHCDDLPDKMYVRGMLPPNDQIFLTVVGTRKNTNYGKEVCRELISALRGLPVVIVSGLAYGIDSIAHETALEYGLKTIAVPGSGLADEEIYPAAHVDLAHRILKAGGALLSPFEETVMGNKWTFPKRNRIMAGMAKATLVIESTVKSGTLITAKHATEFNRDVFAVPGGIFSSVSAGPHFLIRLGATPITGGEDLIDALGFELSAVEEGALDSILSELSDEERRVVAILDHPMPREELVEKLGMSVAEASALISLLELKGIIEESLGEIRLDGKYRESLQ